MKIKNNDIGAMDIISASARGLYQMLWTGVVLMVLHNLGVIFPKMWYYGLIMSMTALGEYFFSLKKCVYYNRRIEDGTRKRRLA